MCSDPSVGYRGILAVHSTRLGPGARRNAVLAVRDRRRSDRRRAATLARHDVQERRRGSATSAAASRSSSATTKPTDREMIFRAHGRFVESLGGRYITAEDVGTSTADMDYVHMETDYVAGLAGKIRRSFAGDGARRLSRDSGVGERSVGLRRVWMERRSRFRAVAASAATSPRSCTRRARS